MPPFYLFSETVPKIGLKYIFHEVTQNRGKNGTKQQSGLNRIKQVSIKLVLHHQFKHLIQTCPAQKTNTKFNFFSSYNSMFSYNFMFFYNSNIMFFFIFYVLLASQSDAQKIAPHRDPTQSNPTHPNPNPTYSSEVRKTHDVIYF